MSLVTYRMRSLLMLAVCSSILSTCRGSYGANRCAPDEEWNKCGVLRACWNLQQPPNEEHCYKGCFCPEGRVRNKDGRCVLPSECPKEEEKCSGKNEVVVDCAKPKGCNTCGIRGNCKLSKCERGCDCKPDYYRDDSGVCVPAAKCPGVCPLNEEYSQCANPCNDCETRGKCNFLVCNKGCDCKEGYHRDENNTCIPASRCPMSSEDKNRRKERSVPKSRRKTRFVDDECGDDEEYQECGTACPRTCQSLFTKIQCIEKCVPGCFCKGDLVRHEGKCIDIRKCPTQLCGLNEEFKKCGSACPETCSTLGHHQLCTDQCVEGCFCKEGFVRDDNGICIQRSQCPALQKPPENGCGIDEEPYSCIPTCRNTCDNYNVTNPVCTAVCLPGCFCRRGWVKNRDGKCVPTCQCDQKTVELSNPQTCGRDEEFYECSPSCGGTCDTYKMRDRIRCACKPGCWCKEGMVKNRDGKCVPTTECGEPTTGEIKKCGEDEEYQECGTACPRTCQSLFIKIRCIDKCVPGCFCKGDLVRHEGKCIEIRKCPTQTCGLNEEFKGCGSACPPTCSSLADPEPRICTQQCVSGCFCKEGLVKNDNGQCVEPTQCPNKKCGENEEYDTCGSACPETCADKDRYMACTQQCKIGCFCKKGYVRNDQGKCIPPDQCPSGNNECSGVNEVMSDCAKPKSCNTCEIRGNCKLKRCEKGCDCKPGYYRNSAGICVQEALCTDDSGVADCSLHRDVGPCRGRMPRFYFDAASGKCKTFTYGGCQGNSNNFATEQECNRKCGKQKVDHDCDKEATAGDCKGNIRRFYFDSSSGECKVFTYGGCGGNKNNFRNRNECVRKCGGPTAPRSVITGKTGSVCDLSPAKGPCTSFVSRYFFNKASGTCDTFTYGGCKGNQNNFRSEDECYQQCGDGSSERPDCFQPADSGPCKALMPRFYFEMDSGECKPFNYGGCQGNSNNFKTADECQRKCGKSPAQFDCDKKADTGPCQGSMPRFYYDSTESVCKRFIYGGCEGNRNNFKTIEECNNKCGGKCGESEVHKECGSACPRTCRNLTSEVSCIDRCVKGCFCKDGLVRNDQVKCILPDQCPKEEQCDGENEVVVDCAKPAFCNTCGIRGNCKLSKCERGCDCKPDYYRNDSGVCVPAAQCPEEKCIGVNEVVVDCSKPTWCNTCGIRGNCKLSKCEKGCDCKPDYYRNDSGVCVPEAQCPVICPLNEEYSDCANPCNDCETRGKCNFLVCNKGCDCKKGYHRDENNICVPASQCPVNDDCDENEEYSSCGNACPMTCENKDKPYSCIQECKAGCFCKKGYVRDEDGDCIPPDQCPAPTVPPQKECGQDEEYYNCAPDCKNTCENYNRSDVACPKICRLGCFCKKGLVKQKDGKCVNFSECEVSTDRCDKGEEYNICGTACPRTCRNRNAKIKCIAKCVPGCFCQKGLIRNDQGKCVAPSQCDDKEPPNNHGCGDDEEYYRCIPTCRNTCDSYKAKRRICSRICIAGCFCKKGWVKNKEGKCIPTSQCDETSTEIQIPPKCGKDEIYYDKCAPSCGGTCDTYDKKDRILCIACEPGCWCKEGMVKNNDGRCVPTSQCEKTEPSNQNCSADEEHYNCIPTCRNTCDNYKATNPICPRICIKGCFCKKGWVKNEVGKCVPTSQCPLQTTEPDTLPNCGKDEVYYDDCAPSCKGTCDTKDSVYNCPLCRPGCWCKKGMVKNSKLECVYPTQCDNPPAKLCGEDEEYQECGTACPRTCQSLFIKIRCIDKCVPGCFCKGDMVRHEGKCIDIRKCPTQTCALNEEYTTCGSACPPTCSSLADQEPRFCTQQCVPGCFCKKGFVKNEDGQCVEPTQCPNETCGLNEEYKKCGSACPQTCANLGQLQICTDQCVPGCFCKDGFVKNDDGQCVDPTQCSTARCDKDEDYQSCGTACPRTCSNRHYQIRCIAKCVPGCFCREGLFRNDQGKCVTSEQCDEEEKCGENEEYDTCGSACDETCANKDQDVTCTQQCKIGCFCKKGYVKNDQGKCIPPDQCPSEPPKKTCGPREQYYDCVPNCHNTCETYNRTNTACPLYCRSGCFCQTGLVLRNDNQCVPPSECNPSTEPSNQNCSVDEEHYECIPTCRNTCDNYKAANPICPRICIKGCFCKKGWVKNEDGKCVPTSQCSQQTTEPDILPVCEQENEVYYKECAPTCGGTCGTYDKKHLIRCRACEPGCWCKEGLVKNSDSKCVPTTECDKPLTEPDILPVCEQEDEVYYKECAPSCGGTCSTYDKKHLIRCRACEPGCWCKEGQVKNSDGKCVPTTECDKPLTDPIPNCPKDQEYYTCIPSCKRTCMTFNATYTYCTKECIRGCFCKEGLVMNKDGNCVPPEKCPENCNFTQQYYDCMPDCQNRCDPVEQCPKVCRPGCFCRPDLVLRGDGLCVRKELCGKEQQCGKNEEYYECYSRCSNSCAALKGKQLACPAVCERGCFCKKGMVVDADGKCVTPDQCEDQETTTNEKDDDDDDDELKLNRGAELHRSRRENRREGEGWNSYVARRWNNRIDRNGYRGPEFNRNSPEFGGWIGGRNFIPNRNFNNNKEIRCGLNEYISQCSRPNVCETCDVKGTCDLNECVVGCDCISGYYRNEDGVCIPESQCPDSEQDDDENDDRYNFIIPPPVPRGEESECGVNEHVVDCAKPEACSSCQLRGNCSLSNCARGCDCLPGYFRNELRVCVPESECTQIGIIPPPHEPCGPNEEPNECGTACPETCENYGKTQMCTLQCVLGCFCRRGLVRNAQGQCVRPEECPRDDPGRATPRPPRRPVTPRRRRPSQLPEDPSVISGLTEYSWEVLDVDSGDYRLVKSQSEDIVYIQEISEGQQSSEYEESEE